MAALYLLGDRHLIGFSPVSCLCELPVCTDDTLPNHLGSVLPSLRSMVIHQHPLNI